MKSGKARVQAELVGAFGRWGCCLWLGRLTQVSQLGSGRSLLVLGVWLM